MLMNNDDMLQESVLFPHLDQLPEGGDVQKEYPLNDEDEEPDHSEDGMSDVEADADTLRSCGWGTDEDYGCFGGDE
jgi:hypothetical protein